MTNNKQQTAVDWLEMEIKKFNTVITREYMLSLCQQAKEMEKEQAIRFALCYAFGQYNVSEDLKTHIEKFYEQTYAKNHIGDVNKMEGGEQ